MRRDTPGMNFENHAERINVLRDTCREKKKKKIVQKRLQVKNA